MRLPRLWRVVGLRCIYDATQTNPAVAEQPVHSSLFDSDFNEAIISDSYRTKSTRCYLNFFLKRLDTFRFRPVLPCADHATFGKLTGIVEVAGYSPEIDKGSINARGAAPTPAPSMDTSGQELKSISTSVGYIRNAGEINKLENAVTRLSKLPASPARTLVSKEVHRKTSSLGNAVNRQRDKLWYRQLMEWIAEEEA